MKFKSIASLLALSFVGLTNVPVLAAQTAHPVKLTRSARREDTACRLACGQAVLGTCIKRAPGVQDRVLPKAPKDDWPANMILDSFRSYVASNAGNMAAPYAI
jgi:hypothetical protein